MNISCSSYVTIFLYISVHYHNIAFSGTFLYVSMATVLSVVTFIKVFKSNYLFGPHESRTKYICQTFNGRLANHIYQYASVYGIAKRHNFTILLAQDDDIVQYFELPSAEKRKDRRICETFVVKFAKHCCVFDPTFMNMTRNQSYVVGEYLQSWKYFEHTFDEVRNELSLKKRISERVKSIVEDYRDVYTLKYSQTPVVVGVHIRRGDLASEAFSLGGVRPAPDEYIHRAVDYMLKKFKNVVFIVCSDGMDYAKFIMDYKNMSVEYVHSSPIEDFALLTSCDHVITTVGSFGWWAGFLSGGTVIYYKYPMKEGTFERTEYNYDDFFPRDWVGLE